MDSQLKAMIDGMKKARPEIAPSQFWVELNKKNRDSLDQLGYDNFKRTIATNYFTWVLSWLRDPQIMFLLKNIPIISTIGNLMRALIVPKHSYFSRKQSIMYNFLTFMLWEYTARQGLADKLDLLDEPIEGNPPRISLDGRLVSQDIANSVLEYHSIRDSIPNIDDVQIIMELGAGYGRNTFVFQKLMPQKKYVIVDIPPALYIAEKYLSSQFPEKSIFKYKEFEDYSEIEAELENADIAFFLPTQLELLPDKFADLFINISSLHEMRHEQIAYYMDEINRLTHRYFYMKQWKISHLPQDNTITKEEDYPIPDTWTKIYWRECAVQTAFFETLFQL